MFEYGTWGEIRAEFAPKPGEILAQEHWCSSGFADLDLVIGPIAHTCVESTVRFAAELGYDVTLVKDAVADNTDQFMHAALVTNLPNYANAIVTTSDIVAAVLSPVPMRQSA